MSSTLIAKNIQIGTSGTPAQNFTWYQPAAPDGTIRLGVGNSGVTTGDVITATSAGATVTGTLTATTFSGSGASLTTLNASNLSSGTVPDARFPATLPAASGANLTALNASNLDSGTIPNARFPATLPAASGANLTNLNGSNIASGTVPAARLGSGTPGTGNFLRGDNTWQAISVTPTTADVLNAYAGAATGAVGTYFFAESRSSPSTLTVGSTVAGGNLNKRDTVGTRVNAGLSGTWRFLGSDENDNLAKALYLRIS